MNDEVTDSPAESDGEDEADHLAPQVTVFLVLGIGLFALFLGYDWFWMVFVLGYAVVLPLVAILADRFGDDARERTDDRSPENPVERLKRRYADGEIDEVTFERRLEEVLDESGDEETTRGRSRDRDRDREPAFDVE